MMRSPQICFLLLHTIYSINALSCKDQSGNDVDWFVAYKLPKLEGSDNQLVQDGTAFLYMDVNTKQNGWAMTTVGIDQTTQAISYTLQQMYSNLDNPDFFHIIYNDEHACATSESEKDKCKTDGTRAHSKGTAVFDQQDGLWLIHSIPIFPPPDTYRLASESHTYGQSMMCITFSADLLSELAEQWYRMDVSVYGSSLPTQMAQSIPLLEKVIKGTALTEDTSVNRTATLQSKGGLQLTHFAKNKKWDQDLYANFVAPALQSDLYVETWQHGKGNLKSGCPTSQQTVWNVKEVNPLSIRFSEEDDHSKFAVTATDAIKFTCIGDINRQISQYKRGGGTMCFADPDVWTTYRSSITKRETCVSDGTEGEQRAGSSEPIGPPTGTDGGQSTGDSQPAGSAASTDGDQGAGDSQPAGSAASTDGDQGAGDSQPAGSAASTDGDQGAGDSQPPGSAANTDGDQGDGDSQPPGSAANTDGDQGDGDSQPVVSAANTDGDQGAGDSETVRSADSF